MSSDPEIENENEDEINNEENNISTSMSQQYENPDQRYCWVCFATDADDDDGMTPMTWVQPCLCRGTTKWIHQQCLQRWVDEKQKGNSFKKVNCPQCQTDYIIVFPPMGTLNCLLEGIDAMVKRLSPFLAAGVIVGSLYWTSVTYGAVTVLQVIGHKEGLALMENADPLVLLVGLPAIPVGLVLGRMIRWEDMILRFIQNRQRAARKFSLLSLILPLPSENEDDSTNPYPMALSDPISATRILCGAIVLPTISFFVGKVFFESVQNNLHRTLLGGVAFVAIKGVLKIYYKQQQFTRKKQRRILDFTEENIKQFVTKERVQRVSNNIF